MSPPRGPSTPSDGTSEGVDPPSLSTDLVPAHWHPPPCNEIAEDHCDFNFRVGSAYSLTEDPDFSDAESVASRLAFQEHRLLLRSWYSWRRLTEGNRRSGKGWDPFNRILASEVPANLNQWQLETDLVSIVWQPNSPFGQPKLSTRTRSTTFSYRESRRGAATRVLLSRTRELGSWP